MMQWRYLPDSFFSKALARVARIIEAGNELCTRYWVERDGTEKAVAFITHDGEVVIHHSAILTSCPSEALRALWLMLIEKAAKKCPNCDGTGIVIRYEYTDGAHKRCWECDGTGYAMKDAEKILQALIGEEDKE